MRSHSPGKICDSLWLLGHPESCVYLVEGCNQSMIISGGMNYIAPAVLRQIKELGLEERKIGSILILHAHFDHIGIIPFFKERFPNIVVYGSERASQILSEPRSVLTINDFSTKVASRMGMEAEVSKSNYDWYVGLTVSIVSDGDVIDLGDMEVKILKTPGHSSCSISAYAPGIKALFPSDGGGIPWKDTIVPAPNSNFHQYLESLKRLNTLDTDYICADHCGYVYGEEAHSYLDRSIDVARSEYSRLRKVYRESGDVDRAAKEVASAFLAENPDYLLTPEIYEGVCRQMVKQISRNENI